MTTPSSPCRSKKGPPVCRFYRSRGGCSAGESCRFAHVDEKPSTTTPSRTKKQPPTDVAADPPRQPRSASKKKQCRHGAACNDPNCGFVHPSPAAMDVSKAAVLSGLNQQPTPPRTKKTAALSDKASPARLANGTDDGLPNQTKKNETKKKMKKCKYGSACRNKKCKFYHPPREGDQIKMNNGDAAIIPPINVERVAVSTENTVDNPENNIENLAHDLLYAIQSKSTDDPNAALNLASELLQNLQVGSDGSSRADLVMTSPSSSMSSKENGGARLDSLQGNGDKEAATQDLARELLRTLHSNDSQMSPAQQQQPVVAGPPGLSMNHHPQQQQHPHRQSMRQTSRLAQVQKLQKAEPTVATTPDYLSPAAAFSSVNGPPMLDMSLEHLGQDLLHQLDFGTDEQQMHEKFRQEQERKNREREAELAWQRAQEEERRRLEAELERKRVREAEKRKRMVDAARRKAKKEQEQRKRQEAEAAAAEERRRKEQAEAERVAAIQEAARKQAEQDEKERQRKIRAAKLQQEKLEKAERKRKEQERKKKEQQERAAKLKQENIELEKRLEQEEAEKRAAQEAKKEEERLKLARMREEARRQQAAAKERKKQEKMKKFERRQKELEQEGKARSDMWKEEMANEKEYIDLLVELSTAEFVRQNKASDSSFTCETLNSNESAMAKLRDCSRVAYRVLFQHKIKTRIVVAGLDKDTNGRSGTVRFWDETRKEYCIGLDTKKGTNIEVRYFKPENLDVAPQSKVRSKKDVPIDRFAMYVQSLWNDISMNFVITMSVVEEMKNASSKGEFLKLLMNKRDELEQQRKLEEEEEKRKEEEDRKRRAERRARENAEWEERKKTVDQERKEYEEFMKDYRREQKKNRKKFAHGGGSFYSMGSSAGFCPCARCQFEARFRGERAYSFFEDFFFGFERDYDYGSDYDSDFDDYDDFDERWSRREAEKRETENRKQAEILGVPADADPQTIKSVYRTKALQYHPDKYREGNINGLSKEESTEQFKTIQNAYDHLMSNFDD